MSETYLWTLSRMDFRNKSSPSGSNASIAAHACPTADMASCLGFEAVCAYAS